MKKLLLIILLISSIFSQSDKLYIGDINAKETSIFGRKKIIEINPSGNGYIVYGKYNGVDFETGELNFIGNDGRTYTNISNVIAVRNTSNKDYVKTPILNTLRLKYASIARQQLQELCEKNKLISVMILPMRDDFYGLTEDIETSMYVDACFNIIENEKGLEYLYQNKIDSDNINDYVIENMGKSIGVDYIIHGFASEYTEPYKYSGLGNAGMVQLVSSPYGSNNWYTDLLVSINNWAVVGRELRSRSAASLAAGTYITLTYYSINMKTGEKKFLTKNRTIMKKG